MLPLESARAVPITAFHPSSGLLPSYNYLRRLASFPQMDLELALYQMVWLCKSPKAVYVANNNSVYLNL